MSLSVLLAPGFLLSLLTAVCSVSVFPAFLEPARAHGVLETFNRRKICLFCTYTPYMHPSCSQIHGAKPFGTELCVFFLLSENSRRQKLSQKFNVSVCSFPSFDLFPRPQASAKLSDADILVGCGGYEKTHESPVQRCFHSSFFLLLVVVASAARNSRSLPDNGHVGGRRTH